jgi:hypothetical protein
MNQRLIDAIELYKRGELPPKVKIDLEELIRRGEVTIDDNVAPDQPTQNQAIVEETYAKLPPKKGFKSVLDHFSTESVRKRLMERGISEERAKKMTPSTLEIAGDSVMMGIPGLKYAKAATKLGALGRYLASQAASSAATGTGKYMIERGRGAGHEDAAFDAQRALALDTGIGLGIGGVGVTALGAAKLAKKASGIPEKVWEIAKKLGEKISKVPVTERAARQTAKELESASLAQAKTAANIHTREAADKLGIKIDDALIAEQAEKEVLQKAIELKTMAKRLTDDFYAKKPLESDMVSTISDETIQSGINSLKNTLKKASKEVTEEYFSANPTAKKMLNGLKKITERKKGKANLKKPETLLVAYNSLKDLYKAGPGLTQSQKAINKLVRDVRGILGNSPDFSKHMARGQITLPIKERMTSTGIGEQIFEPEKIRKVVESSVIESPLQGSNEQLIDLTYGQMGGTHNKKALEEAVRISKELKLRNKAVVNEQKLLENAKRLEKEATGMTIDKAQQMAMNPLKSEAELMQLAKEGNTDLVQKILTEDAARRTGQGFGSFKMPWHGNPAGAVQGVHMAAEGAKSILASPRILRWLMRNRKQFEEGAKATSYLARKPLVKEITRNQDGSYTEETKQNLRR